MTSASLFTRAGTGAVIGTLAAALVLTGCSSGDDSSDAAADDGGTPSAAASTPAPSPSESASAGATAAPTSTGPSGSWLTTSNGKTVALMINGKEAGLFDSGGNTCTGAAAKDSGMQMIALKCTNGSNDRSHGMVESVTATTLKVKWEGFGEETYTRAQDGKLPEGLPTGSLTP